MPRASASVAPSACAGVGEFALGEIDPVQEIGERVKGGDAELRLRARASGGIGIMPAHDRDAFDPLPGAGMVASEVPEPRNADPRFRHRTMPRSELRTNSTNSWTSG
jgi:hypothetical protein